MWAENIRPSPIGAAPKGTYDGREMWNANTCLVGNPQLCRCDLYEKPVAVGTVGVSTAD